MPRRKHFLVSSLNDTRSRKRCLLLHRSRAETFVEVEIHTPDHLWRNLWELGTTHSSLLKSRERGSEMLRGESLFVANRLGHFSRTTSSWALRLLSSNWACWPAKCRSKTKSAFHTDSFQALEMKLAKFADLKPKTQSVKYCLSEVIMGRWQGPEIREREPWTYCCQQVPSKFSVSWSNHSSQINAPLLSFRSPRFF